MEKLVHCDKMYEFIRLQEPINAHYNSTAANVGHFQILIHPSAFQEIKCHREMGLDTHSLPRTGETSHYMPHRPPCIKNRWNESSHHNLIKEVNFASKQDKYQIPGSPPFWAFPTFASALLCFSCVESKYLSSTETSPRWQSPSTMPARTAFWLSANHRKQFIPLLMIYVISLDLLLAYEVFCFFYYNLENQMRVFENGGSHSAKVALWDGISVC